jgi:hypothetical protein
MFSPLTGRPHAAVLLCAALLLAGCRRGDDNPPVVSPVPDPAIRQQVEARLAAEPSISGSGVRVEVRGGMVILHGSVAGLAAWQCALRNAALVEGVLSVTDYLVIGPGPREVSCLAPRSSPPPG